MIDLFFFRDLFTHKEKWAFAIFYIIIGIILLAGKLIILGLKAIIGFINVLSIGSK